MILFYTLQSGAAFTAAVYAGPTALVKCNFVSFPAAVRHEGIRARILPTLWTIEAPPPLPSVHHGTYTVQL